MAELEFKRPYTEVTAMVIGVQPIGEYDRRVVLLTRERGKISAFAKGARRPNSQLVAATDLFVFGTFRLYAGRDSYTLTEASVQNYFSWFRTHIEASLEGQYFCEVLEYCTRENNDEAQLLLLLYQTLRALESEKFPPRLVRSVFELKTVVIEEKCGSRIRRSIFLRLWRRFITLRGRRLRSCIRFLWMSLHRRNWRSLPGDAWS